MKKTSKTITFIIPIIHPEHTSIQNYRDVLLCLKRTLNNLLLIKNKVKIIIILNKLPVWHMLYQNHSTFILVNSNIFRLLKDLDDGTISRENIPKSNKYIDYIDMKGKYHNKDKGLKYFIGLLYYFNQSTYKRSTYIGLIDGDDYIHKHIVTFLNAIPQSYNMYIVQNGYIMFANNYTSSFNINGVYSISNFTDLCGSNRFFKSDFLKILFMKRFYSFSKKIPLIHFMKNKIVNETFINIILKNIKKKYNTWSILPTFLGIHRIYAETSYINYYLNNFNIAVIPQSVAVKYIHTCNHSCNSTNKTNNIQDIETTLITKYKKDNIVSNTDNGIDNIKTIIEFFLT